MLLVYHKTHVMRKRKGKRRCQRAVCRGPQVTEGAGDKPQGHLHKIRLVHPELRGRSGTLAADGLESIR